MSRIQGDDLGETWNEEEESLGSDHFSLGLIPFLLLRKGSLDTVPLRFAVCEFRT